MRCAWIPGLALVAALACIPPARPAEAAPDRLVEQVRKAIDDGVAYLRQKQRRGNWEVGLERMPMPGGWTSLALLALLNAGVPADDPAVRQGLEYLRKIEPSRTYVVGLQTMVFAQAGDGQDRDHIQRNVDWLLSTRLKDGWSYGKIDGQQAQVADNSNTQYALLGLHAGLEAGARIDPAALRDIRQFYMDTQVGGGWRYRPGQRPSMTMTTAGLCGLLITGLDLDVGKQKLRPDGSAEGCGEYAEDPHVGPALRWIGERYPSRLTHDNLSEFGGRAPFYCLYGIERAGRLTGRRYFGGHDWYEVGCRYLVAAQHADGSWAGQPGRLQFDSPPVVATSFALLFLSKGRTPVLVSKLAYGPPDNTGWNNKHSDMRHLVEYTSRELFKKQPLAWQAFDVRLQEASGTDSYRRFAAELLQSPVVFVNGHSLRTTARDRGILREYLDNGGFLFAEACCGDRNFDEDFRALMKDLFPDNELKELPAGHPVWLASGKFAVPPGEPFPLYGVQRGCKTVVIYSPKPLAGYWEAGDEKSERGKLAFRLGASVLAYATGLEPPRPRLSQVEIVADDARADIKRGYLKVAQLRYGADWQPAPKAMRNLMAEARKAGLDVVLHTEPVTPASRKLLDFNFLYLHGRSAFSFEPAELEHLRFKLKNGGTLFADACCGSKQFDQAFRKFMEALWAEDKLKLEPIPRTDELFSKELNGTAIREVRCRRERADGKGVDEYRWTAPALEGIKYNGRWVVIYSRYDIGCALEKRPASDCLGHDYESAVRLGKAAILYAQQ